MHLLFPHMDAYQIVRYHYLFRKCAHLAEYSVLALLLWNAIRHSHAFKARRWLWSQAGLALALVALYAGSDEFHQNFIPGRTGQFSDVLVDTAGGAVGLIVLWLSGKLFRHW